MRLAVIGFVLLALVISNSPTDAHRKGEENWKQRYRKWRDAEENERLHGSLIGTDEAAAAKLHREEQNSVYDTPSEDELWHQKVEEKKQRLGSSKPKPASEITAWHEEKLRKNQAAHSASLKLETFQRHKRRQPREFNPHHHIFEQSAQTSPPHHTKVAEMARYIVHNSDWAAVAYTSKQPETFGLPMADIFSISDGLANESTGIPYMYVSPKDAGVRDLAKDSRCSLAMSLAQGDYCKQKGFDAEDPRCAHVFLTGKIKTIKNGTEEWARAEKYFFNRHPKLQNMPKNHKFRFAKLKISHILVQDFFGGPAHPSLVEYYAAKPEVGNLLGTAVLEAEAELLPGMTTSDFEKWIKPIE